MGVGSSGSFNSGLAIATAGISRCEQDDCGRRPWSMRANQAQCGRGGGGSVGNLASARENGHTAGRLSEERAWTLFFVICTTKEAGECSEVVIAIPPSVSSSPSCRMCTSVVLRYSHNGVAAGIATSVVPRVYRHFHPNFSSHLRCAPLLSPLSTFYPGEHMWSAFTAAGSLHCEC